MALALAGCALVVCDPLAIIVAKKEEYGRLDTVPRGFGTTATGRLEEKQEPALVREYWVHSERGSRYRVSADQYKAAEVDRPLRVCR